jgi:hypothetical protein
MKRRAFLQSSVALASTGAVVSSLTARAQETSANGRQYYELRLYHLRRGPQMDLFDSFCRGAGIPALNRAGIAQVGVFSVMVGPDSPTMYVLLPHPSLDSVTATWARLDADEEYRKAGAEFINAPPGNPAYVRIESSLMIAFESMPKLEVPSFPGGGASRIFELRTYESHSRKAHLKKIEMFNRSEIPIFRRTGLPPVFFGQTLIGSRLPNLTYMPCWENAQAREKGWSAFGGDDEWKKLRTTPGYTDPEIVSDISNVLLRPAPYSQI